MRIAAVADGLLERVFVRTGRVPTPLFETESSLMLARLLMAATKFGVFEALAEQPLSAQKVAAKCETDPSATAKLLLALAGTRYVRFRDDRYALTSAGRTWLLRESQRSLVDMILQIYVNWQILDETEDFVRTGVPARLHDRLAPEQWKHYQRAMRVVARALGQQPVKRMPVPRDARDMLDIGGSHGYHSVSLCRRHPGLRAVILDLPQAVEHAAPLLAEEGMGDRVVHRPGDALTADLGSEAYDFVLMSNLAHHFSDDENRDLARRIARALRPGGVYAIMDLIRARSPADVDQIGATREFQFALMSGSGLWAYATMADWQRDAGLEPKRAIRFVTIPGLGVQAAQKATA